LRLPAGVVIALALSFGVVILLLVVWSISGTATRTCISTAARRSRS
jgi:hypothetical protein